MLFIVFILLIQVGCQQPLQKRKYWVYLDQSLSRDEVPLQWQYFSNTLHAGVSYLSEDKAFSLQNDPHITEVSFVNTFQRLSPKNVKKENYSFALEQIRAQYLKKIGLDGKGVNIGIIDGGFLNANTSPALANVFNENRVKEYIDYVTPELAPYDGNKLADDGHGTEVFKLIAGQTDKIQFGLAPAANYYLARTDHGGYERRIEEDYVIRAMEKFDSMGVQIINISLGYTNSFDDPKENYTPMMVNGKTSALTKAVDKFVKDKNILVIVAAGNDGERPWRIISTPADAKHALSVGATGYKYWTKAKFSSVGPESLGYLKPEISCFSNIGTSFSAPVITGMAACIKQYDKTIPAIALKEMILKSGHLYPYGNNFIGYGVPDCERLVAIVRGGKSFSVNQSSMASGTIKQDTEEGALVIFYKKDEKHVISQKVYNDGKVKVKIDKDRQGQSMTVVRGNTIVEEIIKQ